VYVVGCEIFCNTFIHSVQKCFILFNWIFMLLSLYSFAYNELTNANKDFRVSTRVSVYVKNKDHDRL